MLKETFRRMPRSTEIVVVSHYQHPGRVPSLVLLYSMHTNYGETDW